MAFGPRACPSLSAASMAFITSASSAVFGHPSGPCGLHYVDGSAWLDKGLHTQNGLSQL